MNYQAKIPYGLQYAMEHIVMGYEITLGEGYQQALAFYIKVQQVQRNPGEVLILKGKSLHREMPKLGTLSSLEGIVEKGPVITMLSVKPDVHKTFKAISKKYGIPINESYAEAIRFYIMAAKVDQKQKGTILLQNEEIAIPINIGRLGTIEGFPQ